MFYDGKLRQCIIKYFIMAYNKNLPSAEYKIGQTVLFKHCTIDGTKKGSITGVNSVDGTFEYSVKLLEPCPELGAEKGQSFPYLIWESEVLETLIDE